MDRYTVPGLDEATSDKIIERLQHRLNATLDLQLTLKHVHWNVVGPNFVGVHEMLDPWVNDVQLMSDDLAERIATLGGTPMGTPGYVATHRTWDDYKLAKATGPEHLEALNRVYEGVIGDHRKVAAELEDLDLVSQDMVLTQLEKLEMHQWFIRAHLDG
ncbi:MAG: DNA starvation/stationary phase protection protein [Egibacteraceae bacterium]